MGNDLIAFSVTDMEKMARALAESNLFGMKTPAQAMALCLIAQAEGMHPAIAARDYHVINNKPTLKADAMLTRFQQAGGKVEWHDYTDTKVEATFSHPQGGSVKVGWDMARAKAAELGSNGMWKKYPRQMLRSRVISEGIRTVFPGANTGFYTVEETQDMVDVTPVNDDFGPKCFKNSALRNEWVRSVQKSYLDAVNVLDLEERRSHYQKKLDEMKVGSEYDQQAWGQLEADYKNAERGIESVKAADRGEFDSIPQHLIPKNEDI
jgi:hypothetical protein